MEFEIPQCILITPELDLSILSLNFLSFMDTYNLFIRYELNLLAIKIYSYGPSLWKKVFANLDRSIDSYLISIALVKLILSHKLYKNSQLIDFARELLGDKIKIKIGKSYIQKSRFSGKSTKWVKVTIHNGKHTFANRGVKVNIDNSHWVVIRKN